MPLEIPEKTKWKINTNTHAKAIEILMLKLIQNTNTHSQIH